MFLDLVGFFDVEFRFGKKSHGVKIKPKAGIKFILLMRTCKIRVSFGVSQKPE
jgi:hypothetical protein